MKNKYLTEPKSLESSSGWLAYPSTPWRRYAARILDTTLNGAIVMVLIAIALYSFAPVSADSFFSIFQGEGGGIYDIMITAAAASMLNGVLIGVSGFTLGKLIFGVKVTQIDGKNIGLWAGLSRDFSVLLRGLGMAIPLVSLFTMWSSYKRLVDKQSTSWDEGKYIVWHRPGGVAQYLLNIIGIVLIVFVIGLAQATANF